MEKLIELAVEEYFSRVNYEPVDDSKIACEVLQEFGFDTFREFQQAVDDRIYEMRMAALGK